MWRGGRRVGLSVAAPFVWRCPSNRSMTPFPHPSQDPRAYAVFGHIVSAENIPVVQLPREIGKIKESREKPLVTI